MRYPEHNNKSTNSETRYSCLSNHFGLISEINHKIQKQPLTWYWRHIKGNQDNKTFPLDIWATTNVEYDKEGKNGKKTMNQDS